MTSHCIPTHSNKYSLKFSLSNNANYVLSPFIDENIFESSSFDTMKASQASRRAVACHGAINLKIKQYKRLQISSIKLYHRLNQQIHQIFKEKDHDLRIRSEIEYNLFINLLDEASSLNNDPLSEFEGKREPRSKSTENHLEILRQRLQHKIQSYHKLQQKHLQDKHEELFHLRKLMKENSFSKARLLNDSACDDELSRDMLAELESSHNIIATLEPIVHHFIDSSSNYLRPSTIYQVINEVDSELRGLGLPTTPNKSKEEEQGLRNNYDYRYYMTKYKHPVIPIAHVDKELKSLRQRHRQMLHRIAKACETFCPYEIKYRVDECDHISGLSPSLRKLA